MNYLTELEKLDLSVLPFLKKYPAFQFAESFSESEFFALSSDFVRGYKALGRAEELKCTILSLLSAFDLVYFSDEDSLDDLKTDIFSSLVYLNKELDEFKSITAKKNSFDEDIVISTVGYVVEPVIRKLKEEFGIISETTPPKDGLSQKDISILSLLMTPLVTCLEATKELHKVVCAVYCSAFIDIAWTMESMSGIILSDDSEEEKGYNLLDSAEGLKSATAVLSNCVVTFDYFNPVECPYLFIDALYQLSLFRERVKSISI